MNDEINYAEVFDLEPEEATETQEVSVEPEAEADEIEPEAKNIETEAEEEANPEGLELEAYAAARKQAEQERDAALEQLQQIQARSGAYRPLFEILARRYGVEDMDAGKLMEAVASDPLYLEDAAEREGLTTEQYQEKERLQRELAALRHDREEQEKAAQAYRIQQIKETELKKIQTLDPSVKSLDDLSKMENFDEFARLARLGNSLADAYKLANYEALTKKTAEASVQAAMNAKDGKSHLIKTTPKGTGSKSVPPEVITAYRQLDPDASMEEIRRLYQHDLTRVGQ